MKNDFFRKRNKYNKSAYEISKETNIDEEKVEKVLNGELELPTEKVDEFVEVLETDNALEKQIKLQEVKNWYRTANLKMLRKEFGYKSQIELAKILHIDNSTLCRLENKKEGDKYLSDALLMKIYDFYHNPLNKNTNVDIKESINKVKVKKVENKNIDYTIYRWYKETNFAKLLHNINLKKLAVELGYNEKSSNLLSYVKDGKYDYLNNGTIIINKLYKYFTEQKDYSKTEEEVEKNSKEEIEEIDSEMYMSAVRSNAVLREKIEQLEKQLRRYETLIDLIK